MKSIRLFLIALLIMGLQLTLTFPVAACSFVAEREVTAADYVTNADLIVIGTAVGASSTNPYDAWYSIEVEEYLKGTGPQTIVSTGYGSGGGDCRSTVAIGERLLFFIKGNPQTDEVLYASYSMVYDAVFRPEERSINELVALIGYEPTLPDNSAPMSAAMVPQNPLAIVGAVGLGVSIVVVATIARRL